MWVFGSCWKRSRVNRPDLFVVDASYERDKTRVSVDGKQSWVVVPGAVTEPVRHRAVFVCVSRSYCDQWTRWRHLPVLPDFYVVASLHWQTRIPFLKCYDFFNCCSFSGILLFHRRDSRVPRWNKRRCFAAYHSTIIQLMPICQNK